MNELDRLRAEWKRDCRNLTDWAMTREAELDAARAERDALAQAIWDAYGILGFDQDGDRTPAAAIAGAKHDYAAFAEAWLIRSAREQAKDHTDLLDECTAVEAERDALRDAITTLADEYERIKPTRPTWESVAANLRAMLSEADNLDAKLSDKHAERSACSAGEPNE